MRSDEITHGTYAITMTSELTPDEVVVGDEYKHDGGRYVITRKAKIISRY